MGSGVCRTRAGSGSPGSAARVRQDRPHLCRDAEGPAVHRLGEAHGIAAVSAPLRVAILTISDAGSRGERSDSSGDLIANWAKERGYRLAERALVPDETERIAATLTGWADRDIADLVLTTGG